MRCDHPPRHGPDHCPAACGCRWRLLRNGCCVMAARSSIPRASAGWPETAIRVAIRSIDQHQMYAAAALGRARGVTQRHAPAVVYDDTQACELGRGVDPRSFSRLSHWLPFSSMATDRRVFCPSLKGIRRNSPVRAVTGCAGAFINHDQVGCSLPVVHSTPCQQISRRLADMVHSASLSSAAAFTGFQTSEALNGRVPNSSGAIQKSEGELPNVCC